MKRSLYGERDYAFGQMMLTLRVAVGMTQGRVAELLGVSRRAVGEWEAGGSYPKAEHLKQFIEIGVKQQAFPKGREAEEIYALWKAAHQKVLLDEEWLHALLGQQLSPLPLVAAQPMEGSRTDERVVVQSAPGVRVDWGEALAISNFYGREQEQALLARWVVQERCRVISILGMGGIGKSALMVSVMYQLAEHFEVVLFRSLRDAPLCEELLDDCLQVLSPKLLSVVPGSLEQRISLLLEHLRTVRVLLVLDNLEFLLEEEDVTGRYRPGFEGYGRLLRRIAETEHQGCLMLTSREKPVGLRSLEGKYSPVRSLRLAGLDAVACKHLLAENDVTGSPQEWTHLVEAYAGNPLALKIVAETIADLFGGAIDQFLVEGAVIFGSISDLLDEQFTRLSALEQTVFCWLAIMREPVTLDELLAVLVVPLPRVQVLEAVDGLRRRSLIERGQRQGSFTLQSVVLEYVTEVLIAQATSEIQQRRLDRLIQHGLEQAHAKEYVRQAQERLLVAPLLVRLQRVYQGRAEMEEQMLTLLDQLRERAEHAQGYGPANLIALLRLQRGHLRGIDLSHLVIRGANMQGVEMQDASLAGAMVRDCVFTEAVNAPWSVAISRNGNYWAVGSIQGKVHVWLKGVQTLHLIWLAHTDATIGLAFSPDERTLASASWDGSIKLWDLNDGALLWMGWHTNSSINSVAFAPVGNLLASSGNDAAVRLWDPQSGTNLQTLSHPNSVYAITWSRDGRLLASGDFEGKIRVWEKQRTQKYVCVQTLSGHSNWVEGLAFAPDGRTLASASRDQTVKLWEVKSGRLLQTLSGHTDQVKSVAWSPDGRLLASCSRDKTIWLWDVEQSSYRAALHGHSGTVYSIAFAPDSRSLLSGSEDGTLRVWEVTSAQCIHVTRGYAVSFYDIDWSPDSTHLVSGSTDSLVTVWDVRGGTSPRMLRGHIWIVYGVAWSPDGRWLASSGCDVIIRLWNPTSGVCTQTIQDPDYADTLLYGVSWSPDGQLLACGTYKRGVQVWDVAERSRRWVGRADPIWIYDVAWSSDGTRLASTTDDGSVYLWDASDGTQLRWLSGHHGRVNGIAWSPDGRRLASCSGGNGNGELFVWDVGSGERVRSFEGGSGVVVYAVAWSPSGDVLISGGSDGMLCWWDIVGGTCVNVRKAHRETIQSLRVSPDGQWLASCGDDGAIMIWDLPGANHLQTLRHDRPYERLNITGIIGITAAQKETLQVLGAIDDLNLIKT